MRRSDPNAGRPEHVLGSIEGLSDAVVQCLCRRSFRAAGEEGGALTGPFDLILIDDDHSENGCRHDFETLPDMRTSSPYTT
jgi:hypothetical protein